jgi:hypothetical protein
MFLFLLQILILLGTLRSREPNKQQVGLQSLGFTSFLRPGTMLKACDRHILDCVLSGVPELAGMGFASTRAIPSDPS